MALSGPSIPLLRIGRQLAYRTTASSSSRASQLPLRRHYSDHQESPLRSDDQLQEESSRGRSRAGSPTFVNLLLRDDFSSEPDLDALDELNPLNRRRKGKGRALGPVNGRNPSQTRHPTLWNETLQRVLDSFTKEQLNRMCADAKLGSALLNRYKVRRGQSPPKAVQAKRLLIHRFNMQDPALVAEDLAASAKSAGKVVTTSIRISQVASLLLAVHGQEELQSVLQSHRVKMRPRKSDDNQELSLLLQGSERGVKPMEEWISSFCDKMQSVSSPWSSFSASESPVMPPNDHRIRILSQLSRAIVSIDEYAQNVTIHSVDDASLEAAQKLLVEYAHEEHCARRRHYHSYASPAMPTAEECSVPTYAFIPHVGPSPLPWLNDPGRTASHFRLARQDDLDCARRTFSNGGSDTSGRPLLRPIETPETYDATQTSDLGKDTFKQLRSQIDVTSEESGSWSYTVEFGDLLFRKHDNEGSSSRILSLLEPPVPGDWPLEHGLEWLRRGMIDEDQNPLVRPAFCPNPPPLATELDAGLVPVAPYAAGREESGLDNAEERNRRQSEKWAEQLSRMDMDIKRAPKNHALSSTLDMETPHFEESLTLVYAGEGKELIIQLREREGKEEGIDTTPKFLFHQAHWRRRADTDVLVPEAPTDMRLSAIYSEAIGQADLKSDESLKKYLDCVTPSTDSIYEGESADASLARTIPHAAVVNGEGLLFVSARRSSRWTWAAPSDSLPQHDIRFVLERTSMEQAGSFASSFKVEFGGESIVHESATSPEADRKQPSSVNDDDVTAPEETSTGEESVSVTTDVTPIEVQVPRWDEIRPYVDVFLSHRHCGLRG